MAQDGANERDADGNGEDGNGDVETLGAHTPSAHWSLMISHTEVHKIVLKCLRMVIGSDLKGDERHCHIAQCLLQLQ